MTASVLRTNVAVFDAWQFRRQRLAAGALAWRFHGCLAAQFFIDSRQVHVDGLVEQHALFPDQCFAGLTESHALVISQLKRLRFDLEVLLGQHCVLLHQPGLLLFDQYLHLHLHLHQRGGAEINAGKFVERIYAEQLPGPRRRLQA
jgi:hypothetical protein